MDKKCLEILNLIKEGNSLDSIQSKLSLDVIFFNKYLKEIKDNGYNLYNIYHSNGEIYSKKDIRITPSNKNKTRINIKDKVLKSIFISDLHIGNIYSEECLLDIIYNYAVSHNIHIIFNGGDVIEGIYLDREQDLSSFTLEEQTKKVLKFYPFDKNIINFILYGNHDYKGLVDEGFDVARYLEQNRYDLVSLGYGSSEVLLLEDSIGLMHDLRSKSITLPQINPSIYFRGHSHKAKNCYRDNKIIYIPALSEKDICAYEYPPLAGFLDVEFSFYNKKIERVNIRQLVIIDRKIRMANEELIVLQKIEHNKNITKKIKR